MSKIVPSITLSPSEVTELAWNVMPRGIALAMTGPPGCGKSSVGMNLAEVFSNRSGIPHYTSVLNASQCEPTEVVGIPYVNENKRMEMASSWFWPENDYTIIVIEEPMKGPKLTQSALCEAIREKRVGNRKLPPHTMFYLSWNNRGDGAGDERILSHFVNRMMVVGMAIAAQDTLTNAIKHGWNPFVLAYLQKNPQKIFEEDIFKKQGRYDPENPCFPSPRSWEYTAQTMDCEMSPKLQMAGIQGLIGQGPTTEFFAWLELNKDMPDIDVCINTPTNAPLPENMSVMYALCIALAYKTAKPTVQSILTYIKRLRREYQVLWAKSVADRNPELVATTPEIRKWIVSVSDIIQ